MYIKEKILSKIGKVNLFLSLLLLIIWVSVYLANINNVVKLTNYEEVGKFQQLVKKIKPSFNDISISFKFYINKLNEDPISVQYENIFQTANYNDGIRLEFARLKGSESRWAIVYTDNNMKLQGVDLGILPDKEQWQDIKIRYIDENKQLIIYLNNQIIKSVNNVYSKFNFDNIVSGYGFSKDRVFNGKVYNFQIEMNPLSSKNYKFLYLISILIMIFIFRNLILYIYSTMFSYKKHITKENLDKYLVGLIFLLFILFYVLKYTNQVKLDNYVDTANQISLGKVLNIKDNVSIEFDFKIEPLQNKIEGIQYENLFQTADWNNGFRLELARKSESATLYGLAYTNKNNELNVIQIGTAPIEGFWHRMKIEYLKSKNQINIYLDNVKVKSTENVNPRIDFSNIIVGKAFENRIFNGKICNFIIQKSFKSEYIYIILSIVISVLFMNLIVLGLKMHMIKTNSFNKLIIYKKSFLLALLILFFSLFIYKLESFLINGNDLYRAILIFISILSIIFLLVFFNSMKNSIIKSIGIFILYITFYIYITFYFSIFIYSSNKVFFEISRYGLSMDDIAAIYQTTFSESIQFLLTNITYKELIIILGIPFILMILLYISIKYIKPVYHKKTTLLNVFLIIIAFLAILPSYPTLIKSIYSGFSQYSHQVIEMKQIALKKDKIDFNISTKRKTNSTHIIVIGESANKEHMGAYGYFRETTPWLSQQINNPNFIFFQNTYAPYCHTVPALLKVLTAANQYNDKLQNTAISIIDVAKKAGFRTYWISEQQKAVTHDHLDTPLNVIIQEVDKFHHVDEGGSILKVLEKTMNELDSTENNLIVLHLMGSHADYKERIREYKDIYKDAKFEEIGNYALEKNEKFINDILNPYDSTIKYTDQLIEKIFNIAVKDKNFVDTFTYFSDHGEDVYGENFHNSANFTFPMVRIPLVMYFSDRYKKEFDNSVNLLIDRKNAIFTSDLLFNTFIDIFNIELERKDNGLSLLDTNYSINETNALTMKKSPDEDTSYYTMTKSHYISEDPYLIMKKNLVYLNEQFPNKILSIDNDLIAKAFQTHSYGFIGSEFNVVLDKLQIGHYPDYIMNTKLNDYLNMPIVKEQKKLWLDLKSERGRNIAYMLDKFEELDKQFNIKEKVYIESYKDGLDEFSKNGWKTVYYIQGKRNSGHYLDQAYNLESEPRTKEYAEKIADKIIKDKITGISFFYYDYSFVKKFVEPLLPKYVKYHVFDLPSDYDIQNKNMIDNIIKLNKDDNVFLDKRVETILLGSISQYEYRHK